MSNYPLERKCKHGLAKRGQTVPEYWVWAHMLQRCENPKDAEYQNYGARGISVCDQWHDFQVFYADMEQRPSSKHEIERRDNDGNYEPANCYWATRKEQTRNQRRNRWIEFRGETKLITDWSLELFGQKDFISKRLYKGWALDEALATPKGNTIWETRRNRKKSA